jgi:hypothetical protein
MYEADTVPPTPRKSVVVWGHAGPWKEKAVRRLIRSLGLKFWIDGWRPGMGLPLYDTLGVSVIEPDPSENYEVLTWAAALARLPEPEIHRAIRKAGGQEELAAKMTAAGHPVSQQGVSVWKLNRAAPSRWHAAICAVVPGTAQEALEDDLRAS